MRVCRSRQGPSGGSLGDPPCSSVWATALTPSRFRAYPPGVHETPPPPTYDPTRPWNQGVRGTQALPLINDDAPVIRVEAGPGTGKTFGLTRRVQRILHPEGLGARGSEVLVVAFNRVIAKQLENGINEALAVSPHDGSPSIRTVHALCLSVIGGDLRLLMDHEREAMIYDVLEQHPELRERLGRQPNANQALHDHEARHAQDVALWQAVFRWLTRHRARLISELPGLLLDSIKQGDYADLQFKYVIVDEFQDLTPGEQELFFRLRREGGQFLALGDPRQSIYAFRGNDREGLSKIGAMAAPSGEIVHDVSLPECQRCPVPVVVAANYLMTHYPPPMTGGTDEPSNIHVVTWPTPQEEARGMARAIVDNIRRFLTERHLVMVTRRKFGYWLRDRILELQGDLGIDLSFSESILESWPTREAFLLASLLHDPDPVTWRVWLGYTNSATGEDFKAPKRNAAAYLRFLEACTDTITEEKVLDLAERDARPPGQGGTNLLERAKRFKALRANFVESLASAEERLRSLFSPDLWIGPSTRDADTARSDLALLAEKTVALAEEYRAEHPEADPGDLVREAVKQMRYLVATREPFVPKVGVQLQVTTLWGAKGVTAEHVYILGMCDEAIPGAYREGYPGTREEFVEEQRRLLYVSLTRARKTLVISRATSVASGEAKQLGLSVRPSEQGVGRPRLYASSLLRELVGHLPNAVPGLNWPGCQPRVVPEGG